MSVSINIPSDLVTLVQSDDRKYFEIPDKTGVYNATTNTGGYGNSQFPLSERRTSDIIKIVVKLTAPNDTTEYTLTFDGTTTPTAADIADEVEVIKVTSDLIGMSADTVLNDGIYAGTFYVYFLVAIDADYTSPDLVTTDASAWTAIHDIKAGSLISIDDVLYEVDTVSTGSPESLTLVDDTGLADGTGYDVYAVYSINFTALLTKSSEKCWIENAPKALSDFCCNKCKSDTIYNIIRFSTLIDGAKASYLNEDNDKVQEIVDYLVSLCADSVNCSSSCS